MLGTEAIWACLHLDDPPPRDWCHRVAVVIFAANVPASLLALHYRSQVIRRIRMPPETQDAIAARKANLHSWILRANVRITIIILRISACPSCRIGEPEVIARISESFQFRPVTLALSIPLSRGNRWIEVLLPLEQGNDHGRNREISQANGDHNGDPVGRPAC